MSSPARYRAVLGPGVGPAPGPHGGPVASDPV